MVLPPPPPLCLQPSGTEGQPPSADAGGGAVLVGRVCGAPAGCRQGVVAVWAGGGAQASHVLVLGGAGARCRMRLSTAAGAACRGPCQLLPPSLPLRRSHPTVGPHRSVRQVCRADARAGRAQRRRQRRGARAPPHLCVRPQVPARWGGQTPGSSAHCWRSEEAGRLQMSSVFPSYGSP